MISTRSVGLVIDTVVCLTLVKWETVSGQFGGHLSASLVVGSENVVEFVGDTKTNRVNDNIVSLRIAVNWEQEGLRAKIVVAVFHAADDIVGETVFEAAANRPTG